MTDLLIYKLMQQKMGYLSTRQGVLAQNIANANTPGFKAKDVEAPDFAKMVKSSSQTQLAVTHPSHMVLKGSNTSNYKIADDMTAFETSPDGNSVNLEDQMVKMNNTAMDYRTTTTLYRKMGEMMRLSTSGNSGG